MVIGGVDLVTVKEILGHADIKMTMRYAHPTSENKRKAVDVLAAIFGAEGQKEDKIGRRKQALSEFRESESTEIANN